MSAPNARATSEATRRIASRPASGRDSTRPTASSVLVSRSRSRASA